MQHTFTNNENRIQILKSKCHASRHGRRYHKTKHDEYYSIDERSLDKYNFIRRSTTAMQIKEITERPESTTLLFLGKPGTQGSVFVIAGCQARSNATDGAPTTHEGRAEWQTSGAGRQLCGRMPFCFCLAARHAEVWAPAAAMPTVNSGHDTQRPT